MAKKVVVGKVFFELVCKITFYTRGIGSNCIWYPMEERQMLRVDFNTYRMGVKSPTWFGKSPQDPRDVGTRVFGQFGGFPNDWEVRLLWEANFGAK